MISYHENHFIAAQSLYRQRLSWLQMGRVDMQSMMLLEYRLRVNLHVLAHIQISGESEPEAAPDTFVYLASRLCSNDSNRQQQAAAQACHWLAEDTARAHGARDALLLFPHPLVWEAISKAYRQHDNLRALLIYILAQQGAELPQELFNLAELRQQRDPSLLAQILNYAAYQPGVSLEQFNAYYQPLLDQAEAVSAHPVLVAALWGGMLRRDPVVPIALRRAIERETNDMQRLDLLRLGALSGNAGYFPIFEILTQHIPQIAYHFLAMLGHPESMAIILQGLNHPRTAQYAELAWWWVSGQSLPKKPRLSVVGIENLEEDLDESVGFVPDAKYAQQWWNRTRKDSKRRYLQGQPLNNIRIQYLLKQNAGIVSHDLIDLLALQSQQPMLIGTHTWHDMRIRKLQAINETTPTPTDRPIEAQHA